MSDEAARRREARRRRILENPEGRMSRILGSDIHSKEIPVSSSNSKEESLLSNVPNINEDLNESPIPQLDISLTEDLKRKPLPSFVAHKRKRSEDLVEDDTLEQVSEPCLKPLVPQQQETPVIELKSVTPPTFLYGLFPIVALGIIVYVMILLELQGMFLNTIFVPFASIEIARFTTQRYYFPTSQSSDNFISAALVLSGFRKEVALAIRDALLILQTLATDVAFYIFTFLCCQSVFGIV